MASITTRIQSACRLRVRRLRLCGRLRRHLQDRLLHLLQELPTDRHAELLQVVVERHQQQPRIRRQQRRDQRVRCHFPPRYLRLLDARLDV